MLIDFTNYNRYIGNRRKNERSAAGNFAQFAQLIEPGDCFFVAINACAKTDPYQVGVLDVDASIAEYGASPVFLKFIHIINVMNVGVECMVATVEGIWDIDNKELLISNISRNRKIYPSFVDILYLKCEIYQFDGKLLEMKDPEYMYMALGQWEGEMRHQIEHDQGEGKDTKPLEGGHRGGIKGNTEGEESIEPTHFDVSIYTGNDVEISSQFETYKEHPEDENPDDPENPEDSEPENTEDPEPEDPKDSGDQR